MHALHITFLLLAAIVLLYPVTVLAFKGIVAWTDLLTDIGAREPFVALCLQVLSLPLYVLFIVLDVAFNWSWGSYFFGERPHEFLFTSRVERHYRTCAYEGPPTAPTVVYAHTPRQREAVYWANWLNKVDPQHVTMHKG